MSAEPRQVVDAYLDARDRFDFEGARAFLADSGFEFRSPIVRFDSADIFIQHATLAGSIVLAVERRKIFVDAADVCHFLTYRIQISEKLSVEVAHWARVEDGRIRRIETIFDATAYRQLFPDT